MSRMWCCPPDQIKILRLKDCCSLYHVLWATSVVLIQQLHADIWQCEQSMLNTDLNPVCGTSEPQALVEQGRFLMDKVGLKSFSRPVVHWRQVSGRDVLTVCVHMPSGWNTHRRWVTAAIPGSNTSSGLWVYRMAWYFISTVVLCHGTKGKLW